MKPVYSKKSLFANGIIKAVKYTLGGHCRGPYNDLRKHVKS